MAKGKTRERRQARTRIAIVLAAEEILETQGLDALNMRSVAERIDYSASNLYEYFSSKDELLAAVISEALARLTLQVRHLSAGLSPRDRLQSYGRAYLDFARVHPALYLLIFGRKIEHSPLTGPESALSAYTLLEDIIRDGISTGLLQPRPGFGAQEMTFGCWSLVHGIAMLRLTAQATPWETFMASDDLLLAAFINGLSHH